MRTAGILGAALLLGACNAAAEHREEGGRAVQRAFPVGAFERVALAGSHDVVVTVGGAPSVRAEGSSEALDRLEIGVDDGELRIASRDSGNWSWFSRHRGVTIHVTVPSLAAASITGSGDMRIDRVEAPGFAALVAGSGGMDIARMRVGQASFALTGSGEIRASGTAQRSSVAVAGSGGVSLERLETADATIALTGSGDISVRATGTARVELRGSGDVSVTGPARCTVNKAGPGDVRCGG